MLGCRSAVSARHAFICAPPRFPPAGCSTIIWVHIFSCHNSARYWDQPDRFLPERFMQPGAEYAASGPQGKTAGEAAAGQQAAAAAAGGQSAPPSQEKLPGDGSSAQGEAEVQHRPDSHGSSSLSPSFSSRAVGSGGGSSQPLRFFPFSQGPRNCVGQSLAKMDYLAILAVLLGRYTFQLTPEVGRRCCIVCCLQQTSILGVACNSGMCPTGAEQKQPSLTMAAGDGPWRRARHHQPDAATGARAAGASGASRAAAVEQVTSHARRSPCHEQIQLASTIPHNTWRLRQTRPLRYRASSVGGVS